MRSKSLAFRWRTARFAWIIGDFLGHSRWLRTREAVHQFFWPDAEDPRALLLGDPASPTSADPNTCAKCGGAGAISFDSAGETAWDCEACGGSGIEPPATEPARIRHLRDLIRQRAAELLKR